MKSSQKKEVTGARKSEEEEEEEEDEDIQARNVRKVFCPILLNFLSVLLPGRNLRDLVAASCNAVFGSRSYFVVFVCQFS